MFYKNILEFDKVLEILSEFTRTKYGKLNILNLEVKNNLEEVNELLDETETANNIFLRFGDLIFDNYENVLDYILLAEKNGILEPLDFLLILNLINSYNNIASYILNLENELNIKPLKKYIENKLDFTRLKSNITLTISKDGKILDQASKELFQIRRKISQANNKIRQSLNSFMQNNINKVQDILIVIRNNRLCIPIKIEYKNSVKGIIHDISQSNTTCYIEIAEVIELQNSLNELEIAEKNEIKTILANLSLLVSSNSDILKEALTNLTSLDSIFAKAKYAKDIYNRPKLTDKYLFSLENARHPLINRDVCVPISIKMNEQDTTIIITGPNTGGKTVTLKTVGLLTMMTQAGLFIDASEKSIIHVFDTIVADIGDDQSIKESLSTFSSHINKVIQILNSNLTNSLVLFDELGSGTDPKEGSALAIAIIEGLRRRNAKTITTTHYIDLKNYAYNTKGVINASVEFNQETLKPTYRLLLGVPGESNAIFIATSLGMPLDIIDDSNNYLHDESNLNIKEYEENLRLIKTKELELEDKIKYYDKELQNIENIKKDLEINRNKYIKEAQIAAKNILEDAQIEAKTLLKNLKDMKDKADIKAHEIAKLSHDINSLEIKDTDSNIFNEDLNVGDYVYIKSYEKDGIITKVKKNKYEVNFGIFTMDFEASNLVKKAKPKEKKENKKTHTGYNSIGLISFKLDLRGKRYEEVKDLLEEFIDKATLANYSEVTIVHGFGTGVVRERVQQLLKTNPNVKSYRYGKEGEGLNGVTIVTLK